MDEMNSITEQLARFEANAEEFTEFVNSLQEVDS
jgi:exonuclease VII small subunit